MSRSRDPWQPTRILRQEIGLGTGTRPIKVVTDRAKAYLKAMGNPEGPHVLACDLLGTQLARWLGLPTFDFAVIEVKAEYGLRFLGGEPVTPGPAFLTREDAGDGWGGSDRQLDQLINPEDLTRLVILDTWILNCDRYAPGGSRINWRNVFLSEQAPAGRFLVRAMDHSHCFTCGRPLTPRIGHIDPIRDERIYGLFPEFRPRLDSTAGLEAARRLGEFRRSDADSLTQGIPQEWDVDRATRDALAQFLTSRAAFLGASIMDKLCPNEG
ncbi:hypothetical protein OJF2_02660 [Aquisphaera giovannonii]|uniref:HipA-like kinase domain-containing protein n=1 Tax=Aquisphaera giovannonii TaxID=406548 RepID=A0A5B9VVC7_9BACT|nr:HipA family kinase [Aquisphaera giovannonii]QEH31801.1 hypothetical protein OJF2_02660 [Aquisphaera giovannonii]